jgi:hypothetical protein
VTFEIDTDGIVKVTARDPDTAQVASTQIHLSSGLSEQEIRDLIDKHQQAAPVPEPPMSAAALVAATVAAAAAAPAAVATEAADPFDALAVGGTEVEFDIDQLEAVSAVPIEGSADADLELDLESNTIGVGDAAPAEPSDFEREIDLEGADDEADPLDSLDEADLDSLAALGDDDALPADEETPPEAITQRRAAPTGELFDAPGTDLSIFGDDEDEEV